MKNVFLLGGSGFVGAHVCAKLAARGWHVTLATRRRSQAQMLTMLPGLTVLELDVHDPAALTQALAGHSALVNLVAILHGQEADFQRVHVALPKTLAKACAHTGVRQVVHISALGADAQATGAGTSMYLRSKSAGEALWCQAALDSATGFDLTLLRPSVIFGAEDKFLNVFAKLQRLVPVLALAAAQARFQPVWVEDVARAVVRCLDFGRSVPALRIIEACGPEVFTLKQLVQLAGRLSGVTGAAAPPVLALPAWAGRLQARLLSMAPGTPMMSLDNLDSMQTDNVATGRYAGLAALGICAAALEPIAHDYLARS